MGPGIHFIYSAALPGVYLSPCVYEPDFNMDKYGTVLNFCIRTFQYKEKDKYRY